MKKILEDKDQFVGRKMNEIIKLDDYCDPYKLYLFDDAVFIEKAGWGTDYSAMNEYEVLKEAVSTIIKLDRIAFEYKVPYGRSNKSIPVYNVLSTEIEITSFGKDLIANGVVTEQELMEFANKQILEKTEDIAIQRERHIDECLAVLAKYGINVKQLINKTMTKISENIRAQVEAYNEWKYEMAAKELAKKKTEKNTEK